MNTEIKTAIDRLADKATPENYRRYMDLVIKDKRVRRIVGLEK